jgi:Predicted sugar kinase
MLRAMRLADRQRSPVLGVNLGKLGFLAEVDVPDLADALSAIDNHEFTTEPRLAVDAVIGDQLITAFNDIAFVRFPGRRPPPSRWRPRAPLRQLRRRRDRGRDADRLDRLQLLRRRSHREPRG